APPVAFGEASAGNEIPDTASIGRFIDCAGNRDGGIYAPGRTAIMQQRSPDSLGMIGVKRHINCARVFVTKEDLLPGSAAITGAEDATLGAGTVGAAHGRNKHYIRIAWINGNAADVPRRGEPDILPGPSGVSGLIDTVAVSEVRAEIGLARAHINDVGIRLRDR